MTADWNSFNPRAPLAGGGVSDVLGGLPTPARGEVSWRVR